MSKLFSKTVNNRFHKKQVSSDELFTREDSPYFSSEGKVLSEHIIWLTIITTNTKVSPTFQDSTTSDHNSQYDLNILDQDLFTQSLSYLLVQASPSSNDVEVLYSFSIPEDNVMTHKSIREANEVNLDEDKNDNEPVFHTIYSKNIISSNNSPPFYHYVLKQAYNDIIIGEVKRVSLVGEPTITIRSDVFFLEAELRRTGAFSNTWHFGFEGRDYRWKPLQLGAKDCDLTCELIEYDLSTINTSSSADNATITSKFLTFGYSSRKNKIKVATLSRNSSNSNKHKDSNDNNTIGELVIFKETWLGVKEQRAFEVLILLSCMVMLDIIQNL